MPVNLLRNLPSVNELLESPPLRNLVGKLSHNVVVTRARGVLDELRNELRTTVGDVSLPNVGDLAERIARRILEGEQPALRPVVNATGILLHTGLGRAPLAEEAIDEIVSVARGYASVEVDLASGERSQRMAAVSGLLCELTGAEAALVVNNNAGATMLALSALCAGREVIVSRGQLIEIGGSYRLPDVMSVSGAKLREVGTTNKTRIADYRDAIGETTAALFRAHTSNYRVVGFTEEATLAELVALGRQHTLPVIDDIGSGALVDFAPFGITGEPIAAASIRQGADVVLFSGDKLLGGPQCGCIVGRRDLVERIAKHPMTRALRVDKLTLAALAATLRLYRNPEEARRKIPLLELLTTPVENLKLRAERLAPQLAAANAVASATPVEDVTYLGGGAVPNQELKTWAVAIAPRDLSVDRLAHALRTGTPSVVGRIQDGKFLLDLRTVFARQDQDLVTAVSQLGKLETKTD
jgi:L-seryl-tRNA(Ser) seleniumtransferase